MRKWASPLLLQFPLMCFFTFFRSEPGVAAKSAGYVDKETLFYFPEPPKKTREGHRFVPQRVFLRHVEETGHGFGLVRNYSTLAMLWGPSFRKKHVLSMLDVRGHSLQDVTDDRRYAWNIGYVARYIPPEKCRLLGVNAFYDYRQGCIDNWHRVGLGMEVLGKRWDFRLNAYFPCGEKNEKEKCVINYGFGFITIKRAFEFMYTGFNAELGYLAVPWKKVSLYLALGPYWLDGGCDHEWGGQLRARMQYKDYIALEGSISHDEIFKTVYQGKIVFSLPLYSMVWQRRQKGPCNMRQRTIYQPVERFDIIPLGRRHCVESNF